MKELKNIFITTVAILIYTQGYSQDNNNKKTEVETAILQQDFIFKAQIMIPSRGRQKHLNADYYTVSVTKDTILSDLPYIGRAYSAAVGNTPGGVEFTSTKFEYKMTPRKKGGWTIEIEPMDAQDVSQMTFIVSENGSTNLQVTNKNRQPISYNGIILINKKR